MATSGEFEIVFLLLVLREFLEFYEIKQVEFCARVQNIAQSPNTRTPQICSH